MDGTGKGGGRVGRIFFVGGGGGRRDGLGVEGGGGRVDGGG